MQPSDHAKEDQFFFFLQTGYLQRGWSSSSQKPTKAPSCCPMFSSIPIRGRGNPSGVGTLPNVNARSAPLPQLRPDTGTGPRMFGHISMPSTTNLTKLSCNISALCSPQLHNTQKLIHHDPFALLLSSSLII